MANDHLAISYNNLIFNYLQDMVIWPLAILTICSDNVHEQQ